MYIGHIYACITCFYMSLRVYKSRWFFFVFLQRRYISYYHDEMPLEEISTQNLIWSHEWVAFSWVNENCGDAQNDRCCRFLLCVTKAYESIPLTAILYNIVFNFSYLTTRFTCVIFFHFALCCSALQKFDVYKYIIVIKIGCRR